MTTNSPHKISCLQKEWLKIFHVTSLQSWYQPWICFLYLVHGIQLIYANIQDRKSLKRIQFYPFFLVITSVIKYMVVISKKAWPIFEIKIKIFDFKFVRNYTGFGYVFPIIVFSCMITFNKFKVLLLKFPSIKCKMSWNRTQK